MKILKDYSLSGQIITTGIGYSGTCLFWMTYNCPDYRGVLILEVHLYCIRSSEPKPIILITDISIHM